MIDFLFGETVLRIQPGEKHNPLAPNRPHPDWNNPIITEIPNCIVYPSTTDETQDVGRDTLIEALTVLLPPGTELHHHDRLEIRGKTYDVNGEPFAFRSPFDGWEPGVQARAERQLG